MSKQYTHIYKYLYVLLYFYYSSSFLVFNFSVILNDNMLCTANCEKQFIYNLLSFIFANVEGKQNIKSAWQFHDVFGQEIHI